MSLVLLAYNQEGYVTEAVQAALAQTYPRLEIILSDDCSPDATFARIQESANAYRGPHRVILNRNPSNLGIGAHVNLGLEMAAGELIVLAAGDDISEPERVARTVALWLASDRKPDAIWSKVTLMDAAGRRTGELDSPASSSRVHEQVREFIPCLLGCSHATTKRLFRRFGPMPSGVKIEDKCLAFRALLCGGFGYIDEPLVRYRIHAQSVSNGWRFAGDGARMLAAHVVELERKRAVYESFRRDLDVVGEHELDHEERERTLAAIVGLLRENETERLLASGHSSERVAGFLRGFFGFGAPLPTRIRYLIMLFSPRSALAFAASLER